MNFLIDAQLPPALARLITSFGHHAVHVEEAKLLLATDQAIWDYAVTHQHIIITKDEDFKNMLLLTATSRTPVVWVRIGNCSNAALTRCSNHSFLKCSDTFSKVSTSLNCIDGKWATV